jgi:hypothetical protein
MVRIPEQFRGGIREGTICRLTVGENTILRSVRGLSTEFDQVIRMDEFTRNRLQVRTDSLATFEIREVGWLGQFLFAWNASEPASRVAARLGILSLVLGLLGLVLGVVSLL